MKKLSRYFVYVRPNLPQLITALICGVFFGISSGFGMPVIFDKVLREIFLMEGEQSVYFIAGVALLLPGVFAIRAVFGYASSFLMIFISLEVLRRLKQEIFTKVQNYPMAFFDKFTTGDLMIRLNGDTAQVQSVLITFSSEIFRQPLQVVGAISFLAYLCVTKGEVVFLLIFFAAVPFCILPVQTLRKRLKRHAGKSQVELSSMTQMLSENLDAVHEVRTFNLQEGQSEKFNESNRLFRKLSMKVSKYELIQQPFMETMSAVMIAVTFVYAYYKNIDFATFSAIGIALYFTIDPIKRILRMWSDLVKSAPLMDRINEILDYETSVPEPANPVKIDGVKGTLSFENVSFSYKDKPALKNATITIPAGTSCALVGESGAGKSTFAKLAMRLYDPNSGCVKMDGISLKDFAKKDFAAHLGSVPQYPVLFNDTIYNNIALGKEGATKDEIEAAAKAAYAHAFITELEDGYDTVVGERGDRLSGGQKQRIALARVFLKNPPFIVLDEATSALDVKSEESIQQAIDGLMQDRTMLIIAHRFSTIRNVQKIIVFHDGEIADFGTHEELMGRCQHYRNLYERQMSRVDS